MFDPAGVRQHHPDKSHTELLEVVVIIMVICLVVLLIEINESCNIFDVKQKVK